MNSFRISSPIPILAVALVLAGCGDNSVNPKPQATSDQTAITGALATVPMFIDDGTMDDGAATNLAPALPGSRSATDAASVAGAAIDPLFFWRTIEHRTLRFEFAFADSDSTGLPRTAFVTARRNFSGLFNVAPRDPDHPDLPAAGQTVHKALLDHWVRHFRMQRIDLPGAARPQWRLAAASAVEVTAENATSLITGVRIETSSLDTTLTDPAALIPLRRVLRFAPDDTVTVTVTTPRTDDVVLLYHHDRRMRLENQGGGVYSGKFVSGSFAGWRHFAVNALSHGSLYDDAEPYDSKAWIYPYVITGGPDVDYLP